MVTGVGTPLSPTDKANPLPSPEWSSGGIGQPLNGPVFRWDRHWANAVDNTLTVALFSGWREEGGYDEWDGICALQMRLPPPLSADGILRQKCARATYAVSEGNNNSCWISIDFDPRSTHVCGITLANRRDVNWAGRIVGCQLQVTDTLSGRVFWTSDIISVGRCFHRTMVAVNYRT